MDKNISSWSDIKSISVSVPEYNNLSVADDGVLEYDAKIKIQIIPIVQITFIRVDIA